MIHQKWIFFAKELQNSVQFLLLCYNYHMAITVVRHVKEQLSVLLFTASEAISYFQKSTTKKKLSRYN
jgi:hypothetical protein